MARDFDEEYDEVRRNGFNVVDTIHKIRNAMEAQMTAVNGAGTLFSLEGREDGFFSEAAGGERTLMGTQRFLVSDFIPAMRLLQETLEKYSALLLERMKKEKLVYDRTEDVERLGLLRAEASNHRLMAKLAVELKQLEQTAEECDRTLRELEQLAAAATRATEQLKTDLEAIEDERRKKEAGEKEAREDEERKEEEARKRQEEEEEQKRKEEEEQKRKEEEEQKRKEEEELRRKEEEEARETEEEKARKRLEEEENKLRVEEERMKVLRKLVIEEMEESFRQKEEKERLRKEEEERLRREEEERHRREEEERQRREEEERIRLEKEEEERRRRDPRFWTNVITYDGKVLEDDLHCGIFCVVRVPDGVALEKPDLTCTLLDRCRHRYPLQEQEHEEMASNLINVRPTNGTKVIFESEVWLALPYQHPNRTSRETSIRIQTPLGREGEERLREEEEEEEEKEEVEEEEEKEEEEEQLRRGEVESSSRKWTSSSKKNKEDLWQDAELTQDTLVHGQEPSIRFVQTSLREIPAEGLNFTVTTKLRKDYHQFNNKGGKLISSVDPRIFVQLPRNAFRLTVNVTLQVIPIDNSTLADTKSHYNGCEHVIGCSPIVIVGSSQVPQRPLNFAVSTPFGGKHRIPSSNVNRAESQRDKSLPKITIANRPDGSGGGLSEPRESDHVVLLTRSANGKWRLRQEIVLDIQRDSTLFQLAELAERCVLLRTSELLEATVLSRIAENLERSLREKLATIIVRQGEDDNTQMFVEVCKSDNVNKIIPKLRNERYTDGPPTQVVSLREGDLIDITFDKQGNIDFQDSAPTKSFVFNSNIASGKSSAEIKEKDIFAQNASDNFKGNLLVRLSERAYDPPTKLFSNVKKRKTDDSKLLAVFNINLPKLPRNRKRMNRIRIRVTDSDPLSEEYFDHLGDVLADEWKSVAKRLRCSTAAVERIVASNEHHVGNKAEAMKKSVVDMLTEWFKTSAKTEDKADELRQALMFAGRNDLAEELAIRIKEYRQKIDKKFQDANLEKIFTALSSSEVAVKAWKKVAKEMGLSDQDILDIEGEDGRKERVHALLKKWMEKRGKGATKDRLVVVLKRLKLNEAAANVSRIR